MVSARVVSRSFVGRVAELEHMIARRRDAAEGRGGAVLIGGDAGIGKSRFVREFERRTGGAAGSVVVAECRPFAQRPLGPIADILGRLAGSTWEPSAEHLASRAAVLDAIVAAFDRACARRMRTVVIEDLHSGDPELVQIFALLAERAAHRRLLLVATYRENEISPEHPNFTAFGRLLRQTSVTRVTLEPLTGSELAVFVSTVLREVDVTLPGAVVDDICKRSGGNPLFAEELLRHAVDEQRAGRTTARAPLPISLHAVIRERIDRCSTAERALLAQASVFGRRFGLDVLADVFGIDPAATEKMLRHLRELQLVDALDKHGNYEFRHALTRDAVYSEIAFEDAKRLHERVADTIERRADAADFVELLAHSFWEAGEYARAAPYCVAAADAAMRLHVYDDALLWYVRAADGFGNDGYEAARAVYDAARCAIRLQDPERAILLYERAIALFAAAGRHADVVRAHRDVAGTYFNHGRSREALAHLEAALAVADAAADRVLHCGVLVRMLAAYAALRDVEAAQRCADRIDERLLDETPVIAGEYFNVRSSLHAQVGELDGWRNAFERGVAVLERTDEGRVSLRYSLGSVARQALDLGEMETARAFALRNLDMATKLNTDQLYSRALVTEVDFRAGRLSAVRGSLSAIPAPREYVARQSLAATAVRLGIHLGDDDAIRAAIDLDLITEAEAGGNAFAVGTLSAAFACGFERLGNRDDADALFERASEVIVAPFGHALEIVSIAASRPERAESLLRVVERSPGAATPVNSALRAFLGAVIAQSKGEEARASAFGSDAAARFARIGWPLLEAQSYEIAGDAQAALALYRRLGAFGDVRRLARDAVASEDEGVTVLTPRERELAQLIADGKGNDAAAESLGISRKAVENYLTAIYRKLGINSRAQLAVYMVAQTGRTREIS